MQMPNDKLFFIAIIPTQEVCAEVTAFKEDMRDNYSSKKALKVIPHITLKAPFKLPLAERDKVVRWFKDIPASNHSFTIRLENFGSFNNRHSKVIYVQPAINEPLSLLQNTIIMNFKRAFPGISLSAHEHSFKPHITIAYRDLTDENFEKAWAVYKDKEYKAMFTCSSFCLLQHNGRQWEIIQEHLLES